MVDSVSYGWTTQLGPHNLPYCIGTQRRGEGRGPNARAVKSNAIAQREAELAEGDSYAKMYSDVLSVNTAHSLSLRLTLEESYSEGESPEHGIAAVNVLKASIKATLAKRILDLPFNRSMQQIKCIRQFIVISQKERSRTISIPSKR